MTRVGYKLRREIEDLFPGPCTPAERLVGLEIAEFGNEITRISTIKAPLLRSRTGLTDDAIRKVLGRLAKRQLEFRIVIGKGADGRQIYSWEGSGVQYRVPSADEFAAAHGIPPDFIRGGNLVPPLPVDKPP